MAGLDYLDGFDEEGGFDQQAVARAFRGMQDERRQYEARRSAQTQKMFEEGLQYLRQQRSGPTASERMFALASAFLQPRRYRGFGATLANVLPTLSALTAAENEAKTRTADDLFRFQRDYARSNLEDEGKDINTRLQELLEFAKLSKPQRGRIVTTQQGGGAYEVGDDGTVKILVAPNPGDKSFGSPVGVGGIQEGATATNPTTGQKIIFRGGQWVPLGGGGGNATGGFPGG